jgi:hypothetical protein
MNGGETPGGCRPDELTRCGERSESARLREVDQFDPEGERSDVENDFDNDGQHDPSGISAFEVSALPHPRTPQAVPHERQHC